MLIQDVGPVKVGRHFEEDISNFDVEIFKFLYRSDDFEHFFKNWSSVRKMFSSLRRVRKMFSSLRRVRKTFSSLNLNFWKKCSKSPDLSRKLKISTSIFSHIKWVKNLKKKIQTIFKKNKKNWIFQKVLKIIRFVQKIEYLNINYYEKTKRYNEQTTHWNLENTGKI